MAEVKIERGFGSMNWRISGDGVASTMTRHDALEEWAAGSHATTAGICHFNARDAAIFRALVDVARAAVARHREWTRETYSAIDDAIRALDLALAGTEERKME